MGVAVSVPTKTNSTIKPVTNTYSGTSKSFVQKKLRAVVIGIKKLSGLWPYLWIKKPPVTAVKNIIETRVKTEKQVNKKTLITTW